MDLQIVEQWIARDPDEQTRAELRALLEAGDEEQLAARFAGRLAFGTAGLRGVLGAGPMRMNRLVVRETTAGLCSYVREQFRDATQRGVVVGYDGRRGSRAFAEDAAAVLAARGIKAYLGAGPLPTPLCAFAVREYDCVAGIVVTASHNPPEYNGYKVFWESGAQIIPPHDQGIAAAIEREAGGEIPLASVEQARRQDLIADLGDSLIEGYLRRIEALSVHPRSGQRSELAIAYTPLHGVGASVLERALAAAGFTRVHVVAEQREPDGAFPTVRFPNPEEPGTMDRVVALAERTGAALAIANDPDADRLAVCVRDRTDEYRQLTGDQVGVLLGRDRLRAADYNGVVGTTVVSSRLLGVIARAGGAQCFETLTGFKWLAAEALTRERRGERFLFAYEEALGYTLGGAVYDKDGISAAVAFCELAAELAAEGRTVLDELEAIYREHGLYLSAQRSLRLEPNSAAGPSIGDRLRAQPPARVADRAVVSTTDLLDGVRRHADGRSEPVSLPSSDVLAFALDDDARVIVRPSGTEPKLKCYYEICETIGEAEPFAEAERRARSVLDALVEQHQRELEALR